MKLSELDSKSLTEILESPFETYDHFNNLYSIVIKTVKNSHK